MKELEALALLEWAAPRLGLRWRGFRNVRGQVCKRIQRRTAALGLGSAAAYRGRLEADAAEWRVLEQLCFVTISRFGRDGQIWRALRDEVLPAQAAAASAAGETALWCWSAGCASGEEPYTLSLLWAEALAERHPGLQLRVLATDVDEVVLARAALGRYAGASLRELPPEWREQGFEAAGNEYRLREIYRAAVELRRADLRYELPQQCFRLILCRNLVFTYFDEAQQRVLLEGLLARLAPGGALLIGSGEQLPPGSGLRPWHARPDCIYRR